MTNLRGVSTKLYLNKSLAPYYELLNRAIFDCATLPLLVRAKDKDLISIRTDIIPEHPFGDKRSLHFYQVTCKALGEQNLVVTIGNKPSDTNQYPASSNVTIKFACILPASLTLKPDVQLSEIFERRLSLQDCQSPNKKVCCTTTKKSLELSSINKVSLV